MKYFYYIIISILIISATILACVGIIKWVEAITLMVLSITAIAIFAQAFYTKEMAKYQLMPAVDINMIYENQDKKTYFWFSNSSNLPATISFELTRKNDNKNKLHVQSLRLPPQRKMCTMTISFYEKNHSNIKGESEFHPSEGDEVTLDIFVKLALEDINTSYKFKKDYRFHEYPDKSNSYRWDEITWGFPDPAWSEK